MFVRTVASSLKISSLYLSWIIEVISHVSERKPLVAGRKGDSGAFVAYVSRLDCKTRRAETWLLERRKKFSTGSRLARSAFISRKMEGARRWAGGEEEIFQKRPDRRKANWPGWKSLPRISTYYASEFLILCVPLVARCYDGYESFMRRKRRARVACMLREMEKNILEERSFARLDFRFFFFFVLSACNWNFSARWGGKSGSII